jgi:hypothetical protein
MGRVHGEAFQVGDFLWGQEPVLEIETTVDARFIQVKIIKL